VKAWTLALKDLRLIVRDRPALIFLVLVPLVVVTIVAETLGGEGAGEIVLPVVDEDRGPVARVLMNALAEHVALEPVSREEAERRVARDSEAPAALVLPRGLSKRYMTSRASQLLLITDPARGIEVATIKAWLLLAEKDAATLADPLYEELLTLEERNATGSRLEIPGFEQSIPGFSLMFVLMGVLLGVASGLEEEKEAGTMTRLRIAPLSRLELFSGKLLARFLVGLAQLLLLFGFGRAVWGISLGPSLPVFLLLCVAIVFSMTGFSLAVACFARTRERIIPLGLTVTMIVCALGGCWWPLYQSPPWLQQLAHAFLTAWSMEAIHDLILREKGLADIAPALAVLFAYGAAGLALGARFYRLAR
jgi:ABC-2 type transport system permease protein